MLDQARHRSTSRLHERARHVWRQGTVHSSLWCLLEGHFRSQSCISRILIDATPPWHEQWSVRHDSYARMGELSQKFEGAEAVDIGALAGRVRRENPDITHLKPKNVPDRFDHISAGCSNCVCRGDLARSRNACESGRSQRNGTKRHCAVTRSRSKT